MVVEQSKLLLNYPTGIFDAAEPLTLHAPSSTILQ
jgi:hypothetical protein